jgi:hypothetical protein
MAIDSLPDSSSDVSVCLLFSFGGVTLVINRCVGIGRALSAEFLGAPLGILVLNRLGRSDGGLIIIDASRGLLLVCCCPLSLPIINGRFCAAFCDTSLLEAG